MRSTEDPSPFHVDFQRCLSMEQVGGSRLIGHGYHVGDKKNPAIFPTGNRNIPVNTQLPRFWIDRSRQHIDDFEAVLIYYYRAVVCWLIGPSMIDGMKGRFLNNYDIPTGRASLPQEDNGTPGGEAVRICDSCTSCYVVHVSHRFAS